MNRPNTRTEPERQNTPASRLAVATQRPYDPAKDPTLNLILGLARRGHGRKTQSGARRNVGQFKHRRAIARALRQARIDRALTRPGALDKALVQGDPE